MKKMVLPLLALCFASNAVKAQAPKIKFEKYTLPNGLKVILHQDKTAPVVAITALYHVGSKNEDTGRTGFAHFFEHLLFEGSDNIKRGEYDKYVAGAGGELNANTTQDRTFYFELLPSNQLNLGLWLESERMMHAKIEQIGVNTQREAVKEEKRLRVDNQPYGTLIGETFKRAFKVHPYTWQPIGSMDHLNQATLQEFLDFYHTYYVPNNCVLSIAGDINIEEAKKQIETFFGPIPKGTKPMLRPTVVEPELNGEVRDVIEDNVQLPLLLQAYRAPKQGTSDYYTFSVLSTLLSGGESARMTKNLVNKSQQALAAAAVPYFLEDAGLFINYALPNMGNSVEKLESSMDSIINDLKVNLVGDKEFQKVKNQIESDFVQKNASMAGIAESLANYETYFGDANLINTEIDKYRKVTKEDLMNVAKKYLNKNNRVVLTYVPKKKG
jgi:predicted Zn-dependent peptidase